MTEPSSERLIPEKPLKRLLESCEATSLKLLEADTKTVVFSYRRTGVSGRETIDWSLAKRALENPSLDVAVRDESPEGWSAAIPLHYDDACQRPVLYLGSEADAEEEASRKAVLSMAGDWMDQLLEEYTNPSTTIEAERQTRVEVARVFGDTASAMESVLRPPDILSRVLEDLGRLVEIERAIGLLGDGEKIDFIVEHGPDADEGFEPSIGDFDIWELAERNEMTELPPSSSSKNGGGSSQKHRLAIPISSHRRVAGMIILERLAGDRFESDARAIAMSFANQAAVALENASLCEELTHLARVDDLTGLWNRGYCFEQAKRELKRADRHGEPLLLLMADIDYFSEINDTYGHPAGDRILEELAERCNRNLRDIDIIGRYGGEEFMIILPQTPLKKGIEVVGERLRECIGSEPIETKQGDVSVTASFGIAEYHSDDDTLGSVLSRADRALSLAKERGRDRIVSEKAIEEVQL